MPFDTTCALYYKPPEPVYEDFLQAILLLHTSLSAPCLFYRTNSLQSGDVCLWWLTKVYFCTTTRASSGLSGPTAVLCGAEKELKKCRTHRSQIVWHCNIYKKYGKYMKSTLRSCVEMQFCSRHYPHHRRLYMSDTPPTPYLYLTAKPATQTQTPPPKQQNNKMALPPIAKATLQSALINAGSNVLAQGIKAYRAEVHTPTLTQSGAF